MMHVVVSRANANADMVPIGWIGFDGQQLILSDPSNRTLVGICREPVRLAGARYDPQQNPQQWLQALHLKYRGMYLRVSEVQSQTTSPGHTAPASAPVHG